MPKQERNKQFCEIEEKIRTDLMVHSKSVEKEPIHFDEFAELKEVTRVAAQERGMSLAEWFRWLNYRWLSVHSKISVDVESRKPEILTAADLGMTEEACNIALRKIRIQREQSVQNKFY